MKESELKYQINRPGKIADLCGVNKMFQETFDPDKIRFRNMTLSDLDRVTEMEKSIFPSPWSKESIRYFIEKDRYAEALVCEIDDNVVGYAFYWLVACEIHIANIAVDAPYRRKKVGKRLMHFILNKGKNAGAKYAILEVRQSNKIAIRMYDTFGFSKTAVRSKYYSDNQEDAVVMAKIL